MTKYFKNVKAAFPSAIWKNADILPVYVARHGALAENNVARYSPDYPFIGNAKYYDLERCSDGAWNEQLAPWPWFVMLAAKPDDGIALSDVLDDSDRTKYFFLIYADENGVVPFRIEREKEEELIRGFETLKRKDNTLAMPPVFKPERWDDVSDELWQEALIKGTAVSTVG
ncbi:MAG TPA: hypothetical protein VN420_02565 [Candidatus Fimivivens sp.]|nr:hypothetical protein [Candidatus Fimivivens sp.]